MTVVGLLLAGELYIHFKDKEVQQVKLSELMNAVKTAVPDVLGPADAGPSSSKSRDHG